MTIFRIAKESDAENLATFSEKCFRETYSANNTKDDIDSYCRKTFGTSLQQSEILNRKLITLLAEHNDQLIAFAQLSFEQAPKQVGLDNAGEIRRFYVDNRWHGKGIAQELMEACLQSFKAMKTEVVWLGVWENNPKAIAFYQKCKFSVFGEHDFFVGSDKQRDVLMSYQMASHTINKLEK